MSMDMSSERVALLTFDDAYLSLHRIALPRLAQFGYPAAVFVPTGFVGRHNGFDCGREPKEEICGWRELAELTRCGISVQSHGVSHRSFAELTSSDVIDEVVRSKQTIEERLGTEVEALAYPFGRVGREFERIRIALIHSGYRAGFLAAGGSLNLSLDWYRLNRLQVFMGTKLSMLLAV
jgi:peptidoglycan/xylan/chitin deacetylase (PgdA/CDA1 family)